ncbi:MAG: hypothetical protein AAF684_02555 [Pseudomonadota bacterium]
MRIGCAAFILLLLGLLGLAGYVAFGDLPRPSEEIRTPVTPAQR